jgi:hypothetical protein
MLLAVTEYFSQLLHNSSVDGGPWGSRSGWQSERDWHDEDAFLDNESNCSAGVCRAWLCTIPWQACALPRCRQLAAAPSCLNTSKHFITGGFGALQVLMRSTSISRYEQAKGSISL